MKHPRPSERGQAIVLIALGIVGLVAIVGLAIDGGFAFSDRRHAQNAADAAALAGALEKINGWEDIGKVMSGEAGYSEYAGENASSLGAMTDVQRTALVEAEVVNTALDIAGEHGFTDDIITNDVRVEIPPINGPHTGEANYVQVFIDVHRNTFFARVIGIDQTHNSVEAVARATEPIVEPIYGGSAVVALSPGDTSTCSGDFAFGGSGTVYLDGGDIFINSDNDCAFQQLGGCNSTLSTPSGDPVPIDIVGEASLNTSCSGQVNADITENDTASQVLYPDDIYTLDPPPECATAAPGYTYDPVSDETVFYPGYYSGQFPPNIPTPYSGLTYRLEDGVYCIDGDFQVTNEPLHGDSVFFYIQQGGVFSIQGGTLNLTAMTIENREDDPEHYIYSGYLIYVDPDFSSYDVNDPADNCNLNGGNDSTFVGGIYAPYCDITVNGNSGSSGGIHSQIVGYTVAFSGDGDINLYYNADDNGGRIEAAELDLTQ